MRKVIFKAISVFTTLAMLTTAMPLKSRAADTLQATQGASQKIQAEFFVSTIGDDSNPGTYAQPFATLQGARDAVRKINKNMTGNIIVNIAAGDYYLSQTLDLNTQDSGTNGYNIIYKSTDGVGAAKLYGGQPVDPKSWILADDTDTANYGMLSSMVGKVYKTHHT